MRLDKYVASASALSRSQAQMAIRKGDVLVDGKPIANPSTHIEAQSLIELSGTLLRQPGFSYFMLHKPAGVICATKDMHHVTAIDLVSENNANRLQIAGRLDKDTTGLVLLTDDGQWNHRLTSPRHQCPKTYEVSTLRPIEAEVVQRFAKGVLLPGDARLTRPAQLTLLSSHHARLILSEGRYHQVKRMFEITGNRVVSLHRSAIGPIILDDALPPGHYRALTPEEMNSIK